MVKKVVLDTETTGIGQDHKIIEIGCVLLADGRIVDNFHTYLNPKRKVDPEAFKVHGISDDFLKDKPLFSSIVGQFIAFIDGAELIIHNAPFDVGFLNRELSQANYPKKIESHCTIFDTLVYAKQKHPGLKNNLDALCNRYHIDNSNRQFLGALLDAEILASVYWAMTGGQIDLFDPSFSKHVPEVNDVLTYIPISSSSPVIYASSEELAVHTLFLKEVLKNQSSSH